MDYKLKEIFNFYSNINVQQTDGHCGPGSTLSYTKNLREKLPELLEKYNIKSMLDSPCGLFDWMSTVKFPDNFKYTGADITSSIVEYNKNYFPRCLFTKIFTHSSTNVDKSLIKLIGSFLPSYFS